MLKKIEKELKKAQKEKNEIKISSLRMLKADIHNKAIQKKEELKDEEIVKVIQKQVRQHKESIEQFTKGNRDDLVDKEKKELAILETFLPKSLSDDELQKIVKRVIEETKATSKKEMGKVIKEVIARAKGSADGKRVSEIASGMLK